MEPEHRSYEPDYLAPRGEPKTSLKEHFVDFFQTLVVFAAIATVIYLFIAQPHKVSGLSMFPNFHDGDYIITDKVSYRLGPPQRGDIVVFKNPLNESQHFIKRVMGLPGETIKVQAGHLYINNKLVDEPYLKSGVITNQGSFLKEGVNVTIPEGSYAVIGDNRQFSSDTREWGLLPKEKIIGKVLIRYWPEASVGIYPEAYKFTQGY